MLTGVWRLVARPTSEKGESPQVGEPRRFADVRLTVVLGMFRLSFIDRAIDTTRCGRSWGDPLTVALGVLCRTS
jgi:hypothetical protein